MNHEMNHEMWLKYGKKNQKLSWSDTTQQDQQWHQGEQQRADEMARKELAYEESRRREEEDRRRREEDDCRRREEDERRRREDEERRRQGNRW